MKKKMTVGRSSWQRGLSPLKRSGWRKGGARIDGHETARPAQQSAPKRLIKWRHINERRSRRDSPVTTPLSRRAWCAPGNQVRRPRDATSQHVSRRRLHIPCDRLFLMLFPGGSRVHRGFFLPPLTPSLSHSLQSRNWPGWLSLCPCDEAFPPDDDFLLVKKRRPTNSHFLDVCFLFFFVVDEASQVRTG